MKSSIMLEAPDRVEAADEEVLVRSRRGLDEVKVVTMRRGEKSASSKSTMVMVPEADAEDASVAAVRLVCRLSMEAVRDRVGGRSVPPIVGVSPSSLSLILRATA